MGNLEANACQKGIWTDHLTAHIRRDVGVQIAEWVDESCADDEREIGVVEDVGGDRREVTLDMMREMKGSESYETYLKDIDDQAKWGSVEEYNKKISCIDEIVSGLIQEEETDCL